jgi:predicted RNA methylase
MSVPHTDDERRLVALAVALGACGAGGELSAAERAIAAKQVDADSAAVAEYRRLIRRGEDPLGDMLCSVRTSDARRKTGSFYTASAIVDAMVSWVAEQQPAEVIDCGAGTGRFAIAAARAPGVKSVIAVEIDPVASLILRARAAVLGIKTIQVLNRDFLTLALRPTKARRAFVGNPPYVRHHSLTTDQKHVGQRIAASLGIRLSGLAGLHAHFVFAAAALAKHDDVLCFILSAEWLDVNYGRGLRDLMLDGLRAEEVHLLDASTAAFADAATTAVIVCARSGGEAEEVRFKNAASLSNLAQFGVGGRVVPRSNLQLAKSWGKIARGRHDDDVDDTRVPLGKIARVHRGVVTGANDFFVMTRARAKERGLQNCVRPVLTRAEDVLTSGGVVRDTPQRKVMLYPPDRMTAADRRALNKYIEAGEAAGLHMRYVPSHRTPWWKPQVLPAPPIVATYMARQAPAFALNPDGLVFLNVIHGLYPMRPLSDEQLRLLVDALTRLREGYRGEGRTYQGGLEKFEPREMELLTLESSSARTFSLLL